MKQTHTIRDIAELAGVSKGTVDRVIHKRGKVSAEVHEKVTKLLDEINFQPNLNARNLKINKVYRICVLIPDPKKDSYWNPCIDGINTVVRKLEPFGVSIETSFFNAESPRSFSDANVTIQDTIPDAVIIVPLFCRESLIALENYNALGIMVSTFHIRIDSGSMKSFVGQDLHQSGRVAAKLLDDIRNIEGDVAMIQIGKKYENDIQIQEEEKGFRDYFKQSVNFINNIISCKFEDINIKNELTIFLKEHENLAGIFVTTSKAYEVAAMIQDITEKKIAVIGYDLSNKNIMCLKKGTIDFLIHHNLKQQVYLGVSTVAEHLLFKREIPDQILLSIDIINSENVLPCISVLY